MNATPTDQRRLLDLAEIDTRMRQADHARKNPAQAARVQELLGRRQELSRELGARQGIRDDLRLELSRIEGDVSVVDARRVRDEGRLQTVTNPKDAQGLESELAALARRKSDLEDAELEIMERLEQAEAAVAEQEQVIAEVNAEGAALSAAGKTAVAEATAVYEAAERDRSAIAASVPAELVALYDRLALRGVGAALLRRQTCEGCRMVLSGTDLHAISGAAGDAVVTCPECGCILVRTEESGL
ncbi:MAG TPA: C4-type zinc ribbon domain-containing protein [Microbacterium sp.]|uniref:zinc ribbon domain-containing protein n=1 Tax=Microbacterium sp. TaxID=51671 RepID=UPI002B467E13|nr:C4-type zinc ribbon domain-containing protein [Microbacterium sp.]HKT56999.1 C4-type zinc ribbon domain-containing protein [Microbacterium sp.]